MAIAASKMRFWIVKGNKNYPTPWDGRDGDIEEMIASGVKELDWGTKRRIPEEFKKDDGIFFWSSSPDCYVIGLGTVIDPDLSTDGEFNRFLLRYFDFQLSGNANITRLREKLPLSPDGQMASFLRAAVVQTIYALTQEQAERLASIITRDEQHRTRSERIFREWGLM